MAGNPRAGVREISTLVASGVIYWLMLYPCARREIRRCRRRARTIPDPTLRAHALYKLTRERMNPEAAVFFAVLAPRRRWRPLVRLMVDFQIAYDYLDAINEQPETASAQNGLQLHRALGDAVNPERPCADYYLYHPQKDDGGYLLDLVRGCRTVIRELPSSAAIEPVLLEAAERCGEGQARNHAVLVEGEQQLIGWASACRHSEGYLWWELAAAGISCLSIHALFAAAACATTLAQARRIDAAYFPSVCAISALLDSLVDRPYDAEGTNHSFVDHYSGSAPAAERFGAITAEACALGAGLRSHRRHTVILAGIASFYLSAPEARSPFAQPVATRTLDGLGPTSAPILAVMRRRRRSCS